MPTIRLKGPGLNDYFAEMLVKEHGPEVAREKCSGPALAAVERVIKQREIARIDGDKQGAQGDASGGTGE